MNKFFLGLITLMTLGGCGVTHPLPEEATTEQRIAQFSLVGAPLRGDVDVYWDDYMIPTIHAEYDADAAFTLGMVQAHLRLGQMELIKRVSQGRISEMAGPVAVDIDAALRAVGFGRAADDIYAAMPEFSKQWLDSYVLGINHYKNTLSADQYPHEFAMLNIDPDEPWTSQDTITIGRLSGTDVNWLTWFGLLKQMDKENWAEIWADSTIYADGSASLQSDDLLEGSLGDLGQLLSNFSKSGSNSFVVGPGKTENDAALIGNDPHLGLSVPNIWMIAGLHSPSYQVVGMMVPGTPVFGFGRTPHFAWGGTNLRGLNSDLVDVSTLPETDFQHEQHEIKVRGWFDKLVENRVSRFGPVLSDADIMPNPNGAEYALRWIGHDVTDEITSLLLVVKARSFNEFTQALRNFAIPAQNFLYADVDGNIGYSVSTQMPKRPLDTYKDGFIISPEKHDQLWANVATVPDFPIVYNPDSQILASANNRPAETDYIIGLFFPPGERIDRIYQILAEKNQLNKEDIELYQKDTISLAALQTLIALKDKITIESIPERLRTTWDLISKWDGDYSADSKAALLYEALMVDLVPLMYASLGEDYLLDVSRGGLRARAQMPDRIATMLEEEFGPLFLAALESSFKLQQKGLVWGDRHRMEVKHPLGNIPVLGARYVFQNVGVGGSQETIYKTAHEYTVDEHNVRYGAQSRHISDLSDPDANYFVLLGGQDGQIRAENFTDQVDLWMKGETIRVPLRLEVIRSRAAFVTRSGS